MRSKILRRRALCSYLLLLVFLPVLVVSGCAEELPAEAIAQVGTALVSQEAFDKLVAAYEAAGQAPDEDSQADEYRKFQQAIAEYLVTLEVIRQEAADYQVSVTEKNVQDELAKIKGMFQDDEDKLAAALERQNITLEQFTQSLHDSLWLDKMKAAVLKDVKVTDEEAEAFYREHKAEYIEPESREVRHILVSPFATLVDGTVSSTASTAEWEAARAEAERVRSELLNGADFVSEAEKYSDDDSTAASGGELGAIVKGQMVPEFEEAVFGLEKGDLSEPVKTPYGYHVIEVTDITPEQQLSFDQVRESIRSALLHEKQSDTWDAWVRAKERELGVVYRKGYAPSWADESDYELLPTTSTTVRGTSTTGAGGGSTSTTGAGGAGTSTTAGNGGDE